MNPSERVRAVYEGRIPDQVPLMLDLSHWYKRNYQLPFDLTGYTQVDPKLVELHKQIGAVCYVETGSFFELYFEDENISDRAWTDGYGLFNREIITPIGQLREQRAFEIISYSYNIKKYLLESVDDFETVCYIMDRYHCRTRFDRYRQWNEALGELAYLYCQIPYSGLGFLMSRYFGVEKTCMAIYDHPEKTRKLVDAVNDCNLRILDEVLDGPAEVVFLSDNFDSNVQNPNLFRKYSRDFYSEVARRVHNKGKYFAVHVDGEMHSCLKDMADCGVDCIDAATPAPMFSLTPQQARNEAGNNIILSGGIPATVFGATGTDREFKETVISWLDTRMKSSRLIMAAGDQVPTDAPRHRIEMLPELIEQYGRY